jgi:RHS repeat-associated protein
MMWNRRASFLLSLLALTSTTAFASIPKPAVLAPHDSRGLTTSETLPDLAQNAFHYESTGALQQYQDPTAETTTDLNDELGRPLFRKYQDGSVETYTWEGSRVTSFTDRQGRKQQYGYDSAGRLSDLIDGDSNTKLDHLDYDAAGRLMRHVTKDAMVESLSFDNDGHPLTTRQTRFRNSSGFEGQAVLDQFDQTHTWNAFGERTSWTMPRPNTLTTDGWTDTVSQEYDGAGNLTSISRTQTGAGLATLMSADFRNAGRPNHRTVTTSCTGLAIPCSSANIVRNYGYDPASGQLNEMQVVTNGTMVGGTHVDYQNTLQVHDLQLLGVSGGKRSTHFTYDDRGRLRGTLFGSSDAGANPAAAVPGATAIGFTPADFLTAHLRTPLLDPATRDAAASSGVSTEGIDPPSATYVEEAGHKTASVTQGGVTRSILYDNNGGQVSDDGRLLYTWDPRGLLVSATEKPTAGGTTIRRALYYYDGNHRMVGRRMEMALVFSPTAPPSTLDWQLENRSNILQIDGFPPEVTFVWDPVSDTLVSVVQVGAPTTDPNAGVLKQIIHGGLGYDDPIEETVPAPQGSTSKVQRLYPTYDEAGTGTLQAVFNVAGELVGRNVPTAVYISGQLHLAGPAVDQVTLEGSRDASGVTTIDVTVRSTEQLTEATIAAGVRLATVDSKGAVVRTVTTAAQLVANDPYAAHITLTADDWTSLTDPAATSAGGLTAAALSVAVTSTLRAKAWPATMPFLAAPDWARASTAVFASAALPVEVRESLPSLADWLTAIPPSGTNTRTLYQVPTLALLAQPSAGTGTPISTLLAARFQAQPFADPFTGKNYVRERWYDPERGSWLSPDPLGYRDSGNLYAYCAGDPVNCHDPTGLRGNLQPAPLQGLPPVGDLASDARTFGRLYRAGEFIRGLTALTPVALGLNIGLEVQDQINDQARRIDEDADDSVADQRLLQRSIRNQSRIRRGTRPGATGGWGQTAKLPGVSPYSQQVDALNGGEIDSSNLMALHNEAVQLSGPSAGAADELVTRGNVANEAREAEATATHSALRLDSGEKQARVVIGRPRDLRNLEEGEESLLSRLPNRGNPRANWAQNAGVLRQAMRRGLPIRDASPNDELGPFLNAERNLLRSSGWKFDRATSLWMPPAP